MEININSTNYITDDIYKYFLVENVKNYKYSDFDNISININNNVENNEIKNFYLILDYDASEPFFHFIAECVVYFKLFNILKKKFPLIKIKLKVIKEYHKTIGEFFDINYDEFVYSIDDNNSNILIFPLPITPLNKPLITEDFKLYSNNLINELSKIEYEKTINILILVRQTKDNYHPRQPNITDIIQNIPNATILNTENISLFEQIKYVKQSKIIITVEGSGFFFNGLFAKNSKILVLGVYAEYVASLYQKMNYYTDIIKSRNKIHYIPYTKGYNFDNAFFMYNDIVHLLEL